MVLSIAVAFLAGLVSFLSPCILPLIPGFLAYLAGTTLEKAKENRKEVLANAAFFVLGFSAVFSLLGVLLSTLLESVAFDLQVWLARIGGSVIILFGLYLAGVMRIPFLEREHKFQAKKFSSRYLTSLVFGAAFAAGWTPCVGAVLGSVLGLAATQPGSAFLLLLSYSLGLGLPFLLVGIFTSQASSFIQRHAAVLSKLVVIFGIVLVILGILVFTQYINRIANLGLIARMLS